MKTLISIIFILNSNYLLAEDIPGKTLLSYFSGSCKSSSQWTQAALADSESLIKSLNAIATDPDCSSAAGAMSQLNSLSAQLTTLEKLNDSKTNLLTIMQKNSNYLYS